MEDTREVTVEAIATIYAVAIGAVVGSFLNVVIHRVPRGESIVSPASHCPRCGDSFPWYLNVPILSWVALRGRCRKCKLPIDVRYPVVELITALAALACVRQFGLSPLALRSFVFVATLIALAYIDLGHWLLPDKITLPGIVVGLASAGVVDGPGWTDALIGAAAGYGSLWLVKVLGTLAFGRDAMGGGDLKLFGMIGAFLGWQLLLPVLMLASVQGSVVGVVLLIVKRVKGEDEASEEPPADDNDEEEWTPPSHAVPFGPFLALGALEALFLGGWMLETYSAYLGLTP